MTNQKDIAKKQSEIVGQLQQFPIGRTNSGGRAGGMVEVVVTNPLPGQPSVVQAKCANDCPPGDVQLIKSDDGSYIALSPDAAKETSVATTRQVSKKDPKKTQKNEDVWPCTVAFLYSRIKPNTENLTDNGAATGDETSWDFVKGFSSSSSTSYSYIARERFDELGDYYTAQDAIENKLKPDRLITPSGGGSGGGKDNAAIASGSADAIIIWFYIGNPSDIITNGRIVKVTGIPFHPSTGTISNTGPGFCMEVYRGSFAASAIFPNEQMGAGPLTKNLKNSFSNLGGKIGYAGRIERWRGAQDYSTSTSISYFRENPLSEPNQTPTSVPSWYTPEFTGNPWNYTNATWFQFGWPSPQYIGCASSSWINIEIAALDATTNCGAAIANDQWYWGGDATPTRGVIDKDNPNGFIGTTGMFVCWQGHKDNAGIAQGFFEAFRIYWGITGFVTRLGACNLYGCELPPEEGGGFPPPPPGDASRFVANSYGRKAELWLKICKGDLPHVEIKLLFEFAAIVEQIQVLGGGSLASGANFENGKNLSKLTTYAKLSNNTGIDFDPYSLENPHATLNIDGEFAYINVFYGGQRVWEEPLLLPIKPRLANLGFGSPRSSNYGSDFHYPRRLGLNPGQGQGGLSSGQIRTSTDTNYASDQDIHPRTVKDCFACCWACIVKLPTEEEPIPTIVSFQKYKRGEEITLTKNTLDNEFNTKFLIADFRTDVYLPIVNNQPNSRTEPNIDFAGFGGLPTLIQFPNWINANIQNLTNVFYKPQTNWTVLDWLYYQLQESPKQYNPLITVLPPGVNTRVGSIWGTLFELDSKFDRHARADKIMPASVFTNPGVFSTVPAPAYRQYDSSSYYPLFISFKEQLIGNGLLINNKLVKWYRISSSSLPLLGQLKRNS